MTSELAAECRDVKKLYPGRWPGREPVPALRDVSLAVPAGCVLGLLGPNRAGKTTLLKILLSVCRPTSGAVYRLGEPIADRRTLARIGYVHEQQSFPRYHSAAVLLEYYGALSAVSRDSLRERIPLLLAQVGLADRANEPIARFSKGMLQRLALAQALVGEPTLLVLDEPSEGMDLLARRMIHQTVQRHHEAGGTTILVSHQLRDVVELCDRACVLLDGRVAHEGLLTDLLAQSPDRPLEALEAALEAIYQQGAPEARRRA